MHAIQMGRLDMSRMEMVNLLIGAGTGAAVFIDKRSGEKYVLNSIQREDGSGQSFNIYATSVKNPAALFAFYVRN